MQFIVMPMRDRTKIPVERGGIAIAANLPHLPIYEHCHPIYAETFQVFLSRDGTPGSWHLIEGFDTVTEAEFLVTALRVHDSGSAFMDQAVTALTQAFRHSQEGARP